MKDRPKRKLRPPENGTREYSRERDKAEALLRSGKVSEAIGLLQQLARRDPTDAWIARQLAIAFEHAGLTLEALKQLDRVIGLDQADAEIWKTTGRLLMMHRETAQAMGAYRQSVELNCDDPETRHERI